MKPIVCAAIIQTFRIPCHTGGDPRVDGTSYKTAWSMGFRNLYHGLQFCLNVAHILWIFTETVLQWRTHANMFSFQISMSYTLWVLPCLQNVVAVELQSAVHTLCVSLWLEERRINDIRIELSSRVNQIFNSTLSFSCTKPIRFDQNSFYYLPNTSLNVCRLTYQLCGPPYEGKELKVVQSPHPLAACWFHAIHRLQLAH